MLKFYGPQPPHRLSLLRLGGHCPHCKTGTRFKITSIPHTSVLRADEVGQVVINYTCEVCLGPIPVRWNIAGWEEAQDPTVSYPQVVLPMREEFDFEYVPATVKKEIEEALDCLAVNAFHGFAAVCRRAVQAISTDLGAKASSRVKKQIEEMADLSGLDDEMKELAIQIMLSGHDGSHPHLPEMNAERAQIILSLLRDLVYELYTRRGKIKEAATARQAAIEKAKQASGENEVNGSN